MKHRLLGISSLALLLAAMPVAALAAATTPATDAVADTSFAGPTAAAPAGSDIDRVGQVIINTANGRSVDQAVKQGGSADNPFGLDADPLLLAAGVYFISDDSTGAALGKSEFSIYPDYMTPGGNFTAAAQTPAIIPFAFNRGGVCFGGYVSGFPAPDKVFAVDMHGKVCNAKTVDDVVDAQYKQVAGAAPTTSTTTATTATSETPTAPTDSGTAAPAAAADNDASSTATSDSSAASTPATDDSASTAATTDSPTSTADSTTPSTDAAPSPSTDDTVFDGHTASDYDLEMVAYGAYTGAYNQALKHDNTFNSADLPFPALRRAMMDALDKEGYGAATVENEDVKTDKLARACATDGKIDLRVAFNDDGVGISVVAVSANRMSAYEYFPLKSSDIVITHADDCIGTAEATPKADGGSRMTPSH